MLALLAAVGAIVIGGVAIGAALLLGYRMGTRSSRSIAAYSKVLAEKACEILARSQQTEAVARDLGRMATSMEISAASSATVAKQQDSIVEILRVELQNTMAARTTSPTRRPPTEDPLAKMERSPLPTIGTPLPSDQVTGWGATAASSAAEPSSGPSVPVRPG